MSRVRSKTAPEPQDASGQPAPSAVTPPPLDGRAAAAGVGRALHSIYDDVVGEDVPDSIRALLDRL